MGTGASPMTGASTTSGTSGVGTSDETTQIASEIAQTREEMNDTIEQLHGRLNPTVLKEEALKQFHEAKESIKAELSVELGEAKEKLKTQLAETKEQIFTEVKSELADAKHALREATIGKVETMVHNTQETVKATGRSLADTVRENPIPAAMIGVGLVWLITNARSRSSSSNSGPSGYGYGQGGYSAGYGTGDYAGRAAGYGQEHGILHSAGDLAHRAAAAVGGVTHATGESLSGLASSARASVTQAAHATQEQLSQAARATQERFSSAARTTQEQAARLAQNAAMQSRKIGHQAQDTFVSNPLAVGAALLAVGAAVGFSIPTTRRENEIMGSVRDDVMSRAGELAHEAREKVEEAAKQAVETVKSTGQAAMESVQAGGGNGQASAGRAATGHHPQGSING